MSIYDIINILKVWFTCNCIANCDLLYKVTRSLTSTNQWMPGLYPSHTKGLGMRLWWWIHRQSSQHIHQYTTLVSPRPGANSCLCLLHLFTIGWLTLIPSPQGRGLPPGLLPGSSALFQCSTLVGGNSTSDSKSSFLHINHNKISTGPQVQDTLHDVRT